MKKHLQKVFLTLILAIGFTSTTFGQTPITYTLQINGGGVYNEFGGQILSLTTNIGDTLRVFNISAYTLNFAFNVITTTTIIPGGIFDYVVKPNDVPGFNIVYSYLSISKTFPVTVNSGTSGISNNTTNKIQFVTSPNPVTDVLTIKSTINLGIVNVLSITGQVLFTDNVKDTNTTIDLTPFAPGTYIVRVGNAARTVIKQ